MKVNCKVSAKVIVEVEAETVRDAFAALASAHEVFSQDKCGLCGSDKVVFEKREIEGNAYHSMKCTACRVCLDFGSHKVGGGLFVKRKDKAGNWIPNDGWHVWEKAQNTQPDIANSPDPWA